ncbi:MAG TPA: MBL fold metallo-hydrolase [Longimicrobiales bacterium]|nr:MBL fold metallo-hydrolase [Longimicrobiales bacterium]
MRKSGSSSPWTTAESVSHRAETTLSDPALTLDTEHAGLPESTAAYRIEGPESTLVDPGPSPSLPKVLEKIETAGHDPSELRNLILTHVHLDHAGAVGHLAEMYPKLTVYVHMDGAPHLVDPERLIASTRRTFGEAYDDLYGEVKPVPPDRVRVWRPRESAAVGGRGATTLRAISTPGHTPHHLAFLDERDGTLYCGDALGLRLTPSAPVLVPTPPPGVDLTAWFHTLDELEVIGPERIAPTHFGMHPPTSAGRVDVTRTHIREFRAELLRLALRARAALEIEDETEDAERYEAEVRDRLAEHRGPDWVDRYVEVFSPARDYRGVVHFLTENPHWHPPRGVPAE